MTTAPETTPAARGAELRLPSYPWRFAHLAALWGFGVSQPVFSMLKGNPEFLVVRGSSRGDVVVFALLLAFAPPILVVLAEAVIGLFWALLSRALHVAAVWCFGYLALLQLVRISEPERAVALLLPVLPAAALAVAYMRWNAFRSVLSISLALPLLGVLSFVVSVPLAVKDRAPVDVAVRTATPVVLVVFDEFPVSSLMRADGSLDAVRYPNFASLAGDGVWYPRATTVHEFTTQAVPAVFTGKSPVSGQLPTLTDHPDNLFTLLGERYALEVVEPVTRLCPTRYCPEARVHVPWADRQRGLVYDTAIAYLYRVLPQDMREELPPIGDRWGGFGESAGTRERLLGALDLHDVNLALEREDHQPRTDFQRFLRGIRRGEPRRTLHVAHLNLPHPPFRLLPSGREYGGAASIDGILDDAFNDWTSEPELVQQALQRHLLQVAYTDRVLGVLVRRLEEEGIYDRALVIVTADHGGSFVAGGSRRYVTAENVADIAGVPLFVKYPGRRDGRIDRRDARTTDVVPTVADVVGIDVPWPIDGRSLRREAVERGVSVGRRDGAPQIASAESVAAGVLATARRNARMFGEGADSLFRIGPNRSLLGRRVDDIETGEANGVAARLDAESLFADVRFASGFVPARIAGEIEARAPTPGAVIAIAVNGRIAATTRSFRQDRQVRFAALVPESVLREGPNEVEVFGVDASADPARLVRLGGTGQRAEYRLVADGRSMVLPNGRRMPIRADGLDGHVESAVVEGRTVRIKGWAADVDDRQRVDRVLLFAGRRLVFASDTPVYRLDIGGVSSVVGLQHVGFVAELPLRDVRGAKLRAIAVRGGVATELVWPADSSSFLAISRSGG